MTAERRTDMFIAKAERLEANTRQAATITVQPGIQFMPNGEREPAIVLRSAGRIHGVLSLSEALRVATAMADAIAAQRTEKP